MIRTTARTARKQHRCEGSAHDCVRVIKPGERYLERVASPDHGDLGNEQWWRMSECATCAETYGRGVAL